MEDTEVGDTAVEENMVEIVDKAADLIVDKAADLIVDKAADLIVDKAADRRADQAMENEDMVLEIITV